MELLPITIITLGLTWILSYFDAPGFTPEIPIYRRIANVGFYSIFAGIVGDEYNELYQPTHDEKWYRAGDYYRPGYEPATVDPTTPTTTLTLPTPVTTDVIMDSANLRTAVFIRPIPAEPTQASGSTDDGPIKYFEEVFETRVKVFNMLLENTTQFMQRRIEELEADLLEDLTIGFEARFDAAQSQLMKNISDEMPKIYEMVDMQMKELRLRIQEDLAMHREWEALRQQAISPNNWCLICLVLALAISTYINTKAWEVQCHISDFLETLGHSREEVDQFVKNARAQRNGLVRHLSNEKKRIVSGVEKAEKYLLSQFRSTASKIPDIAKEEEDRIRKTGTEIIEQLELYRMMFMEDMKLQAASKLAESVPRSTQQVLIMPTGSSVLEQVLIDEAKEQIPDSPEEANICHASPSDQTESKAVFPSQVDIHPPEPSEQIEIAEASTSSLPKGSDGSESQEEPDTTELGQVKHPEQRGMEETKMSTPSSSQLGDDDASEVPEPTVARSPKGKQKLDAIDPAELAAIEEDWQEYNPNDPRWKLADGIKEQESSKEAANRKMADLVRQMGEDCQMVVKADLPPLPTNGLASVQDDQQEGPASSGEEQDGDDTPQKKKKRARPNKKQRARMARRRLGEAATAAAASTSISTVTAASPESSGSTLRLLAVDGEDEFSDQDGNGEE